MAGGIDWFRWHHGSVNDPKFRLVAKRAGARVGDVLAMWAMLLEQASASTDRGQPGAIDFEAIDLALDMADGLAKAIHTAMCDRGLLMANTGRVAAWERRQVKREREDDHSTSRTQAHKQRSKVADGEAERQGTPGNANQSQGTPRGEESREETQPGGCVGAASAADAPGEPAANKRGTRLSRDWVLPKAMGEWALAEFPIWDAAYIRGEAEKFRDFWSAKTGKDATKLDWEATWRNWCRNARGPAQARASPSGAAPNKQQALEEGNRNIAREWAADMKGQHETA